MSVVLDPLSKLVRDAVIAALEESGKPLPNRLMDTEKAAEYLGVEPDAIKRMHAAKKIRSVRIWWISYMLNGEQQNESSRSTNRADGAKLLQKRMGELGANRAVGRARVLTVPDLLDQLEAHYIENERRSIADLKGKIAALKVEFAVVRASEFGASHISRLKASMRRDGAANATVNRYLAILRRAFRLANSTTHRW